MSLLFSCYILNSCFYIISQFTPPFFSQKVTAILISNIIGSWRFIKCDYNPIVAIFYVWNLSLYLVELSTLHIIYGHIHSHCCTAFHSMTTTQFIHFPAGYVGSYPLQAIISRDSYLSGYKCMHSAAMSPRIQLSSLGYVYVHF